MSIDRQLAANRRNAQLSTGPHSPAGKLAVRSNALKHGFYSQSAVLDGYESQSDFDTLQRDFFHHLAPIGPIELELAARLVLALWQLRRLQTAETQALQLELISASKTVRENHNDRDHLILGFALRSDLYGEPSTFEGFARHRVRWERTYYRALHELQRLQLSRRGHAVPPPQVLEIHDSSDHPLPAPLVTQPPRTEPRSGLTEPRPEGAVACPASGPQSGVAEPNPQAPPVRSKPKPAPNSRPANPRPSHSNKTTKPPIGFVSQKSAHELSPARPVHPRKS